MSLHRTSPIVVMVVIQIIEGIGVGFCFQPGSSTHPRHYYAPEIIAVHNC